MDEYSIRRACGCGGYKLILMDVDMPELTGIEATSEIRLTNRSLPIVAVSAYTASDDIDACLQAGMNDYSRVECFNVGDSSEAVQTCDAAEGAGEVAER